jgi:hypothetical protein
MLNADEHPLGLNRRAIALRVPPNLLNPINVMLPVQSPSAKIFPFSSDPNHL